MNEFDTFIEFSEHNVMNMGAELLFLQSNNESKSSSSSTFSFVLSFVPRCGLPVEGDMLIYTLTQNSR